MTATVTAPARTRAVPHRAAPRPTPRSGAVAARPAPAARPLAVVEPPRRRYPARAVAIVAVALVFGSLFASAVLHSVLVSGQARIDELSREIRAAEKGLAQDRLELARLSSPERIASEAERLGLVVAERQTWLRPGSGQEPVVTGAAEDEPTDGATGSDEGAASTGADEMALSGAEGGAR